MIKEFLANTDLRLHYVTEKPVRLLHNITGWDTGVMFYRLLCFSQFMVTLAVLLMFSPILLAIQCYFTWRTLQEGRSYRDKFSSFSNGEQGAVTLQDVKSVVNDRCFYLGLIIALMSLFSILCGVYGAEIYFVSVSLFYISSYVIHLFSYYCLTHTHGGKPNCVRRAASWAWQHRPHVRIPRLAPLPVGA